MRLYIEEDSKLFNNVLVLTRDGVSYISLEDASNICIATFAYNTQCSPGHSIGSMDIEVYRIKGKPYINEVEFYNKLNRTIKNKEVMNNYLVYKMVDRGFPMLVGEVVASSCKNAIRYYSIIEEGYFAVFVSVHSSDGKL